jgi:type VI secretion system protein ImpA
VNAEKLWEAEFAAQTGVSLASVLCAIPGPERAGRDLRGDATFRELRRLREEDDPSLPMGVWEREPKRADFRAVQALVLKALAEASKDLELAVYLLEANLRLFGFAGLAPALWCLTRLCNEYWDELHPELALGDLEHRANVLHATGKRLAVELRRVILVRIGDSSLSWHQLLLAQRNERLAAAGAGESVGGPRLEECRRLLSRAPSDELAQARDSVTDAQASLERFRGTISRKSGGQAPSLGQASEVLGELQRFLDGELSSRGYRAAPTSSGDEASGIHAPPGALAPSITEPPSEADTPGAPTAPHASLLAISARATDAFHARKEAYAALDALAETLFRLDPHSPTPDLLKRAVSWGALSTAELFQELFVRCEGRLSIFDLMGVDPNPGNRS